MSFLGSAPNPAAVSVPQPSQMQWLQMMQNQAMARQMALQAMQQWESGLPQNMQWGAADTAANQAGTDYMNQVQKPEMAKARTSTSSGGLGATTSSFAASKQAALQAAYARQKTGVMQDARTSSLGQINMMRNGTMAGPNSAYDVMGSSYSQPQNQAGYQNTFGQQHPWLSAGMQGMSALNDEFPNMFGQIGGAIGGAAGSGLGQIGAGLGGLYQGAKNFFGSGGTPAGNAMRSGLNQF